MNIIEFWKNYVAGKTHYSQYDKKDFLEALSANVPDWKEQVKNKEIWPDLHSQGDNIAETPFTDVIIEQAGLEFAYYLTENQWGLKHLDASRALDFCVKHISSNWNEFPDAIKSNILKFHLQEFLMECNTDLTLWKNLSKEHKSLVLEEAKDSEKNYFSDLTTYLLWSKELNFKKSPYVFFITSHFNHIMDDILREQEHGERRRQIQDMTEHLLQGWDIPSIVEQNGIMEYEPSKKLRELEHIIEQASDENSLNFIHSVKSNIENIMTLNRLVR